MTETNHITPAEAEQFINSYLAFNDTQLTRKQHREWLDHLMGFRQNKQTLKSELIRKIQALNGE